MRWDLKEGRAWGHRARVPTGRRRRSSGRRRRARRPLPRRRTARRNSRRPIARPGCVSPIECLPSLPPSALMTYGPPAIPMQRLPGGAAVSTCGRCEAALTRRMVSHILGRCADKCMGRHPCICRRAWSRVHHRPRSRAPRRGHAEPVRARGGRGGPKLEPEIPHSVRSLRPRRCHKLGQRLSCRRFRGNMDPTLRANRMIGAVHPSPASVIFCEPQEAQRPRQPSLRPARRRRTVRAQPSQ